MLVTVEQTKNKRGDNLMTVEIIFAIALVAFIIMLGIIFAAPKANYGRESRAKGMTYEHFKKNNGGGI